MEVSDPVYVLAWPNWEWDEQRSVWVETLPNGEKRNHFGAVNTKDGWKWMRADGSPGELLHGES